MLRTLVFAAAVTAVVPALAGETLDRINTNGVLVMSTDPEYPPQSSLDENNDFVGFDIDVGTEIARRMGVEIEFVTPGWDVVTAGRWGGRWDVSVGSMTPTSARAEVLDFPVVYYFTPAALVVHEDNVDIVDPADASGLRIGVGVATTYQDYLEGVLQIDAVGAPEFEFAVEGADIVTYDTDILALEDLKLGDGVRLDAAFTALPTIAGALADGYPIKTVGEPLFYEPLSVAIDKGDAELAAEIVRVVDEMRADGTLAEMSQKWYGANLTE